MSAIRSNSAAVEGDADHVAPGHGSRCAQARGAPALRLGDCPGPVQDGTAALLHYVRCAPASAAAMSRRAWGQSKAGPGSVLRPGEMSLWPTTRSPDRVG